MPFLINSARLKNISSRFERFLKFGMVGTSGVFVNMGGYWAFTRLFHIHYLIASPLAIELSIFNNFFWNDRWTWHDRQAASWRIWLKRLLQFMLISNLTAFGIQYGILILLTRVFHLYDMLAVAIGIGVAMFVNFGVNHWWVFRPQ